MIDKILVAIDDSTENDSVFKAAVTLAKTMNASLMLFHVLSEDDLDYPILPTYAYYSVLKGSDNGMLHQKFAEYERGEMEFLRNLSKRAISQGVNTEYAQLSGVPEREICELADNWSADLIVIGSRGLKGLKEMFIGSVSNHVAHHAPCSVLIVRNEVDSVSDLTEFSDEEKQRSSKIEQSTRIYQLP